MIEFLRRIRPLQALAAAMVVSGAVTVAVFLLGGAGQAADECIVAARVWGGGGTVTGGATVVCGETVTLTATAKEGYCFSHWGGGAPSEGCPLTDELEVETSEGFVYYAVFFKAAPATATPTATATPKTETALPYDLLTAKQVTYPGSYSFLKDVNDPSSAIDWFPKGGTYGLLVHATDADGTLRKDFYSTVQAGDRLDIEGKDKGCFLRILVMEVLPDLKSVHTVKVFEVDIVAFDLSNCGPDRPFNTATSAVILRWHVAPGVAGADGVRVMLLGEPTPGPGRYRIREGNEVVITIPSGMILSFEGSPLAHGSAILPSYHLMDVESGSMLALSQIDGKETGRGIKASASAGGSDEDSAASTSAERNVDALFDQLVASVEIVP